MKKLHVTILLMVMLVMTTPAVTLAAPAQLSATAQTKLDKIVSAAGSDMANRLRIQFNTLAKLQEQEQAWDGKIKTIHYQNEEDLIHVRKRIKLIDADNLSKLDGKVKQTKTRYKPLFDSYTALNQQIELARKLKNTKLNSVLRSQADVMKITVQLARNDIRNQEAALKKAKDNNVKTVKALRATLSNIDPIKVKIKLERSRMTKSKSRFTTEWKTLNEAIKKSEAKSVLSALTSLVTVALQINEHMNTIHSYEKSMNDIIVQVNKKIP